MSETLADKRMEHFGGPVVPGRSVSDLEYESYIAAGGTRNLSLSDLRRLYGEQYLSSVGVSITDAEFAALDISNYVLDLPGTAGNYASTPDTSLNSLAGNNVLRLSGAINEYASTPDSVAVSLTTEFDVRARVALDDPSNGANQTIVGKYATSGQRSFYFLLTSTGVMRLNVSIDGTNVTSGPNSVSAVPFTNGQWGWYRWTWRASDGRVQFFTSPDGDTPVWAQLGSDGTLAVASIFDGTDPITLGVRVPSGPTEPAPGLYRRVEIRKIIDGPITAVFDSSTISPTVDQVPTTLVSSTGETWTMNGTRWNWRRDNEIRSLRVPGAGTDKATAPDSAALSITGDIDIRAKVALNDWTPATVMSVVSKHTAAAGGYELQIFTDGKLRLVWGDGAIVKTIASTVVTGIADGTIKWIRATLDVDNGAVGHDVKFYLSDDGVTWVQLGTTVTTAVATLIGDSTDVLSIGARPDSTQDFIGNIFYVEVRNGIDGTVVANPSFENAPWDVGDTGAATGTDAIGNTWTLVSTVIVQRAFNSDIDIRAKVSADSWTAAYSLVAKWHTTGNVRAYRLNMNVGQLILVLSSDGTAEASAASGSAVSFAAGQVGWVRSTWRSSDGRVQFFTSSDGVTWAQLGTDKTIAIASIADTVAVLELGTRNSGAADLLAGNVYYAEVRRGIGGVVVAKFDTSGVEPVGVRDPNTVTIDGVVWTINGAAWNWVAAA